jgi:hypothetical protein
MKFLDRLRNVAMRKGELELEAKPRPVPIGSKPKPKPKPKPKAVDPHAVPPGIDPAEWYAALANGPPCTLTRAQLKASEPSQEWIDRWKRRADFEYARAKRRMFEIEHSGFASSPQPKQTIIDTSAPAPRSGSASRFD